MCIVTLEKGKISEARLRKPVFTNHPGSCQNAGLTWVWAGLAATCLTSSQEMTQPGLLVWEPHWGCAESTGLGWEPDSDTW